MYKPDNENIKRWNFFSKNKWNIPTIKGIDEFDEKVQFIGFNYAKTCEKQQKTDFGVHFFLDDYQFNRLWNRPDKYIPLLSKFKYVLSPDFSMYTDYPKAMQMWKHYQKHWLGAYMELFGIKVIPTVGWSDKESFEWCFDGEPQNSTVAISSVGCSKTIDKFITGYNAMIDRLHPSTIIFYGDIPAECKGNIVHVSSFTEKWREAKMLGW